MKKLKLIGVFFSGIVIGIALISLISFKSETELPLPDPQYEVATLKDGSTVYSITQHNHIFMVAVNPKGGAAITQVWGPVR